eukprot:TRINITY_DN3753_c0_g1_i1.p1 TRINITY_DN3753_c0_g1~~TRINITY_DN3753_c0_g1_i1.p1  ORF type:complete len:161 (-),score=30.57 TRINITY_DN3753_c0_g1_i1:161-643(-)
MLTAATTKATTTATATVTPTSPQRPAIPKTAAQARPVRRSFRSPSTCSLISLDSKVSCGDSGTATTAAAVIEKSLEQVLGASSCDHETGLIPWSPATFHGDPYLEPDTVVRSCKSYDEESSEVWDGLQSDVALCAKTQTSPSSWSTASTATSDMPATLTQ